MWKLKWFDVVQTNVFNWSYLWKSDTNSELSLKRWTPALWRDRHPLSEDGHQLSEDGHQLSEDGHQLSEDGHQLSEDGHQLSEDGHQLSGVSESQ